MQKLKDIIASAKKAVAMMNHSEPENPNPETENAPVDPNVLKAVYGRFVFINVGLNRHERRAIRAELRKIHRNFHSTGDSKVIERRDELRKVLEDTTKNTPIKVYREKFFKNKIAKLFFVNNPFYVARGRTVTT